MIVVFDLDGTLIDSKYRHIKLMSELLEKNKITVPSTFGKDYIDYKNNGNNNIKYLVDVLGVNKETASQINKEWINLIENEEYIKYDTLYDDTLSTLTSFKNDNIGIYYLSARNNKEELLKELDRLQISCYANEIFITNPKDGDLGKITILADIKNKISNQVVMIGDTEVDFNAAIKLNIKYYILNRGFRSKDFWEKRGVNSFSSLNEIIEELGFERKR